MITEYKALMEAHKVVEDIRTSIFYEEGSSPAWDKVENVRAAIWRQTREYLNEGEDRAS
jgi:hypothetical protein